MEVLSDSSCLNKLRNMKPQRVCFHSVRAAKLFHLISVRVHNYWDIFMTIHVPLQRKKSCSRFQTSENIIFHLTTKLSMSRAQSLHVLRYVFWPLFWFSRDAFPPFYIGFSQNVTWSKSLRFLEILYHVFLVQPLPG